MEARGWTYSLSLKAERPVSECETTPSAFLFIKGGVLDNASRQKIMDANPYYFSFEWGRGPRKAMCAFSQCPRGTNCEPIHWSRASLGGCAVQCAVCHRLGSKASMADTTFCSESCFQAAWSEHVLTHLGLSLGNSKGRPRDAESLGDDDANSILNSILSEGGGGSTGNGSSSNSGINTNNNISSSNLRSRTSSSGSLDHAGATEWKDEYTTICRETNYTPTQEDVGCPLRIVVTALSVADGSRLAGPIVVHTLPVLSPPRANPARPMLQHQTSISLGTAARFRVVSYNILAELYATRQAYPYADSWSLSWAFRKKLVLQELEDAQGDVICLQEVQLDHYDRDISPAMTELGYDGLYKQKSRESMGQYGKVDGCAIFWRRSRFVLSENYGIEFNDIARQAALDLGLDEGEARRYMNRLSRDNVAQVVVLEILNPAMSQQRSQRSSRICVANTHLYSNVQRPDVKLWQATSLLHELEQYVVPRDLALVLCGDLNSEPDSAVYELLVGGALSRHHPELEPTGDHAVRVLPDQADIYHNLDLASAMNAVLGREPAFTNYTATFRGTLDYILFNPQRLYVTAVGTPPTSEEVQYSSGEGLPSACYPSDHFLLCADLALTGSGSVTRVGVSQQQQQQHQQQQSSSMRSNMGKRS